MARPVRVPKNQKLAPGKRVHSAVSNTTKTHKSPGSKAAPRVATRLTDSRRFGK